MLKYGMLKKPMKPEDAMAALIPCPPGSGARCRSRASLPVGNRRALGNGSCRIFPLAAVDPADDRKRDETGRIAARILRDIRPRSGRRGRRGVGRARGGMATARYRIARRAFEPIAEFLRPLPPAAITPLAIFFFLGLGWKLYAFILVFACFWPVYLNAAQAIAATPSVQIETARTFGYGRWATLLKVRLAALPTIFTGLRLAASIALIATIAAEMIAGRDGLGFYLMDAGMTLRVPETFAGLVAAMMAGLLMSGLVLLLRNSALRWHNQMITQAETA